MSHFSDRGYKADVAEAAAYVAEAKRRGLPVPEELERELYVQEALRRGLFPWPTFHDYVSYLNPTLLDYEHVPKLVDTADEVVRGAITNLIVMLPTRYFKTEVFSRLLGSYYLRKNPRHGVALSSYNAHRAWEESESARSYFLRSHGTLRESAQAKKFWGPPEGGQLWAVGVGEGIIGRGYHLGVCDDPIDPEKVLSAIYQRRFQRWWPDKFLSRREMGPHSRTIVVMQRLGTEDPIDWLFRREVGDGTEKAPMHWHVLVMDEIKSDEPLGRWNGPQGLPETCTLIQDQRKVGEVLAPSKFDKPTVLQIHSQSGSLTTAAQRQQRPFRPTGDFWVKKWFRKYTRLPSDAYNGGKDWDTAYTKDEKNSASAWIESYRGPGEPGKFPIYIEDIGVDRLEFPGLVKWMQSLTGPHYVEQKATGKSAVQALKAHQIMAEEVPVKGGKFERASAVQPTVANGRVYVREDIYDILLQAEEQGLLRITAEALQQEAQGLDVNDAFVQALFRHLGINAGPQRKIKVW